MFSQDERSTMIVLGIAIMLIQYFVESGEKGIKARWANMTGKEKRKTISRIFWKISIPLLIIACSFMTWEVFGLIVGISFVVWLFSPITIRIYTRRR